MVAKHTKDWQAQVKGILRAEMSRRSITYVALAEKLSAIGVKEDWRNISNKIGRGSFSAVFLVQCLEAMGCRTVRLGDE